MDKKEPSGMLAKLANFEAAGKQTQPLYDEWSGSYEADLLGGVGYTAHIIATEAFAANCRAKPAAIIDVGCGTGLVGEELVRRGFAGIDGLDISQGMLERARAKGLYGRLIAGDLTRRTPIADATYDAAICVGSFGPGHLGPHCFPEIVRLVKPGSLVVIFMNGVHFVEDDYAGHIRRLEEAGVWAVDSIKSFNYMEALDRPGRLIIAHRAAEAD